MSKRVKSAPSKGSTKNILGQLALNEIPLEKVLTWKLFQFDHVPQPDVNTADPSNIATVLTRSIETSYEFVTGLRCGTCEVSAFESSEAQYYHFKSELHRTNLKRKAKGLPPITSSSDLPSDSPDSESDDTTSSKSEEEIERRHPTEPVILFADDINVHKIYKTLLTEPKAEVDSKDSLIRLCNSNWKWAIFLLRSGRFAGAIFQRNLAIVHKTFQRYTTRRKQGGSQTAHDASGNRSKSAGATLRRYNESALKGDIHDILTQWKAELATTELIFIASGRADQSTFFGAKDLFDTNDPRIRRIPFATYRPTFEEVCRVRAKLQSVKFCSISTMLQSPQKRAPTTTQAILKMTAEKHAKCNIAVEVPQVKAVKKTVPTIIQNLRDGNHDAVQAEINNRDVNGVSINVADSEGMTLLHHAVNVDTTSLVSFLLENGANPSLMDFRNRPPYLLCISKGTRDVFRRFLAKHPDAWDYTNSHIPSPLTEEMKQRKREKENEKRRRARDRKKEQKKILAEEALHKKRERIAKEEEEARQKERDRRDMEAANACSFCGKSSGPTPFTRLEYRYCSVICVQNHRRQLLSEAALRRLKIDGILVAEVVAYYFPKLVQMHNYSAANAIKQKQYNWHTLHRKVLRRLHIVLSKDEINDLVQCRNGAIEQLLLKLQVKIASYQEHRSSRKNDEEDEDSGKDDVDCMNKPSNGRDSGSLTDVASRLDSPTPSSANASISASNRSDRNSLDLNIAESRAHEILKEKEQTITELQETNQILELKIQKLEQLVRLKDGKIQTLVTKLRSQNL